MADQERYEDQIAELEKIIEEIEDESVSVDELSAKVKRAAQLIRSCQAVLKNTEKEVDSILKELGKE